MTHVGQYWKPSYVKQNSLFYIVCVTFTRFYARPTLDGFVMCKILLISISTESTR